MYVSYVIGLKLISIPTIVIFVQNHPEIRLLDTPEDLLLENDIRGVWTADDPWKLDLLKL